MAIIYRCDRCGYEETHISMMGKIEYNLVLTHSEIGDKTKKDICVGCLRQLHDFLKPIVKK